MHKLSAVGLSVALGASLLMPFTTFAYLSPEQVFGGSTTTTTSLPPPPTQREGEAVVEARQRAAAEQRQAAQQPTVDPVESDTVSSAASSKGLFDQNAQYELRQERLDAEKANAPTIIIGDTSVLHSGAPLVTNTGPEIVLAGIAMILAALCTFAFAQVRSRKLEPTLA